MMYTDQVTYYPSFFKKQTNKQKADTTSTGQYRINIAYP